MTIQEQAEQIQGIAVTNCDILYLETVPAMWRIFSKHLSGNKAIRETLSAAIAARETLERITGETISKQAVIIAAEKLAENASAVFEKQIARPNRKGRK